MRLQLVSIVYHMLFFKVCFVYIISIRVSIRHNFMSCYLIKHIGKLRKYLNVMDCRIQTENL